MFKSHEESDDADKEVIDAHPSSLKNFLSGYSSPDIFDADECGLQYQMATETTISTSALPGRRKQKLMFTVWLCCNTNGP